MGKLRLSKKERERVEVMSKVEGGGITLQKASELLGLSYRQVPLPDGEMPCQRLRYAILPLHPLTFAGAPFL